MRGYESSSSKYLCSVILLASLFFAVFSNHLHQFPMRSLFRSHSCNFLQIFVLWALLLSHLSRNVLGDDGDGDDDDNDDDDGYGFDSPLNATDPHDINRVYAVGDTIDVSWESPFDAVKLAFIAEDSPLLHFFSRKYLILPNSRLDLASHESIAS